MVITPNSIDLKSEQECLKKKISIAENALEHILKQIETLEVGSPDSRGHENNGKLQCLYVTKKRFEAAIELLKSTENTVKHIHIDKPEPLEIIEVKNPDGAYLL